MSENYKAYALFNKLATQWNYTQGYKIGLNYESIFKIAKLFDIEIDDITFNKIQTLEFETLKKQNEKSSQNKGVTK